MERFRRFRVGACSPGIHPRMLSLLLALISLACCDDINTIEHIVIFMQENRAFDHYFGTLRGVRGFNDRALIELPSGNPVWFQSVNSSYFELPWHMDTQKTNGVCAEAPEMDYPVDIAMWNGGAFNRWNSARSPGMGMCYFTRADLDYYYELADTFTIGDQYHQSTFTQTNPNRLHLFSGSNGLSAGYPAILDNREANPGWKWETFAETLEKAGVSWKVYQEEDNFDDNGFEWFASFQAAKPGSPLYDKGRAVVPDIVEAFGQDLASGKLPQVSWIIAPEPLSEHANNKPPLGEDLTARLLIQLGKNPQMYNKTMFILNYDEQGGFFDHVPPPTPPVDDTDGKSTVTTVGEVTTLGNNAYPIGLGFRVPLMLISPWTRGGYVVSEVFDHTSVLKFVEKRFNVHCPNISPWRRAVVGDLTSGIDFKNPNYTWPVLPDTSSYVRDALRECATLPPPTVPLVQSMPIQEKGTRLSRALPYQFTVNPSLDSSAKTLTLTFIVSGKAGSAFQVYDLLHPTNPPKKYTVEAGKQLSDVWSITEEYGLSVHGPNGFVRQFFGDMSTIKIGGGPQVTMVYRTIKPTSVTMIFNNSGVKDCHFVVKSSAAYRKDGPWVIPVESGYAVSKDWVVAASGNWYDFSVSTDVYSFFSQRFMGRVENGFDSISDPAMA